MSDVVSQKDKGEIDRLVKSMAKKMGFWAPETIEENVRLYVEIAYGRGKMAGMAEEHERTLKHLGPTPAPKVDVYARPECCFAYCDAPEVCKPSDACRHRPAADTSSADQGGK